MMGVIKQRPNKRLFGLFNLSTHLYAYGSRKDNWWRRWFKKMGDEPVILDTHKTTVSTQQLNLLLNKHGYFLSKATDSVWVYDSLKRKTQIIYTLTPKTPYKLNKLSWMVNDISIAPIVLEKAQHSKIEQGRNYEEESLSKERERLSVELKNKGYYNFDRRFIYFEVDSNLNSNKVNIEAHIENPSEKRITPSGNDTLIEFPHKKYSIQEIYIQVQSSDKRYSMIDTVEFQGYTFVNSSQNSIRPSVILRTLYIKKGDQYNYEQIQYTYDRLASLKAFKRINIGVDPRSSDPQDTTLRVFIDLELNPRHAYKIETEGTNRGGNLGINGNLQFANRNTFKGAEVLKFKVFGGLEAQGTNFEQDDEVVENTLFNTLEYGAEVSLTMPELFVPKFKKGVPEYQKPTTEINIGYSHQFRSAYDRDILNTGLYYNWLIKGERKDKRNHLFRLGVIDFSLVRIDKAAWFENKLEESNNSLLKNSYQNHLISATRFQYEFNNFRPNSNVIRFKTSIESAGNVLRAVHDMAGAEKDSTETYYELFGIRFAQYLMVDGDIAYRTQLDKHSQMAYRFYSGIGIPLSNLNALPFEKSYYGGGANFNRAWVARTMGPGSMADTGSLAGIDRIGDIKLEANVEYRFDIVGSMKGAWFLDAGNIWIREYDPQRPNAEFDVNRFYKELAIGSGIGLRYDAGFFVIRFDVGFKIHDPKLFEGERWVWQKKSTYEAFNNRSYYRELANWNLAIGYPF
jgi:outer membrane protein assembly factor BamA